MSSLVIQQCSSNNKDYEENTSEYLRGTQYERLFKETITVDLPTTSLYSQ